MKDTTMTTQDTLAKVGALALSGVEMDKNNKAIARSSKALDLLIHKQGLAIIVASMPQSEGGHLDHSKSLDFIKALSAGSSRNRVVAWMHEFSNIRFTVLRQEDKSLKISAKLLKQADPDYKPARPLAASAMPFWELNNEGAPVPVEFTDATFARMLHAIIQRADKASAAAKEGKGTFNLTPALGAQLEALRKVDASVTKRAEGVAKQNAKPTPNPNPDVRRREAAAAKDASKDAQRMAAAS